MCGNMPRELARRDIVVRVVVALIHLHVRFAQRLSRPRRKNTDRRKYPATSWTVLSMFLDQVSHCLPLAHVTALGSSPMARLSPLGEGGEGTPSWWYLMTESCEYTHER